MPQYKRQLTSLRRQVVYVLVLVLIANFLAPVSTWAAPQFSDVTSPEQRAAVRALWSHGVLHGYPDGSFRPHKIVTRAQLAAMLARTFLGIPHASHNVRFPDVPPTHWAYGEIALASKRSLLLARPDGRFHPDAYVTYGELVSTLLRLLGYATEAHRRGPWPDGYLILADELGLLRGKLYAPGSVVKRGDLAVILYRALFELPLPSSGQTAAKTFLSPRGQDRLFVEVSKNSLRLTDIVTPRIFRLTPDGDTYRLTVDDLKWSYSTLDWKRVGDGFSPRRPGTLVLTARYGSQSRRLTFDVSGDGLFIDPLLEPMEISSPFGDRIHPIRGEPEHHNGIDLAVPTGSPVVAAQSGKVVFAGENGGYGLMVVVDHENGYSTLYGHLDEILVRSGERVSQGHLLGYSGNTGESTGPHLHFEIRYYGKPMDPVAFLPMGQKRDSFLVLSEQLQ